ncbi:hypothetical protein C8R44DRAFT_979877 [Mycena epipterygia]|nr:hypothetical protein C8R44DRAFT_979877 [Mycena epipterygia]
MLPPTSPSLSKALARSHAHSTILPIAAALPPPHPARDDLASSTRRPPFHLHPAQSEKHGACASTMGPRDGPPPPPAAAAFVKSKSYTPTRLPLPAPAPAFALPGLKMAAALGLHRRPWSTAPPGVFAQSTPVQPHRLSYSPPPTRMFQRWKHRLPYIHER